MIRRTKMLVALAAMLTTPVGVSLAQPVSNYPGLSLTFAERTGTGATTESFEIWMRLSNGGSSDFNFNGFASTSAFGLPEIPLPVSGNDELGQVGNFARYTNAYLTPFWDCAGTFDNCGAGPYDFILDVGPASLYGLTGFGLQDLFVGQGLYVDYLLGTLSPKGGAAAPGVYRFLDSGFSLTVEGVGPNGSPLYKTEFDLARACSNYDTQDCSFERIVFDASTIVPEPATFFLLGGGIAGLAVLRLRRRRNSQRCA